MTKSVGTEPAARTAARLRIQERVEELVKELASGKPTRMNTGVRLAVLTRRLLRPPSAGDRFAAIVREHSVTAAFARQTEQRLIRELAIAARPPKEPRFVLPEWFRARPDLAQVVTAELECMDGDRAARVLPKLVAVVGRAKEAAIALSAAAVTRRGRMQDNEMKEAHEQRKLILERLFSGRSVASKDLYEEDVARPAQRRGQAERYLRQALCSLFAEAAGVDADSFESP